MEPGESEWGLICPFWIDTEHYSDRDRLMFCAGYEFAEILQYLRQNPELSQFTILKENESRVKMAAGRFQRVVHIESFSIDLDPQGIYSDLIIQAKDA